MFFRPYHATNPLARIQAGVVWSLLACFILGLTAQSDPLNIDRSRKGEKIPISLSGFTSTTTSILRYDLEIQGFIVVPANEATFQLLGSSGRAKLEGRLKDSGSSRNLFFRGYDAGDERNRAHSLSNDVVKTVLGTDGIGHTRIAFRGKVNGHWEIFVSDFDGYNARMVTNDRSNVAAPTWIPGELGLYYTSYKVGSPNIVSHDLRSGNRVRITRNTGLNTSAALSPDGRKLAMILSKAGSPDLYVARKDGSGVIRLTTSREEEACPTWSHDGQSICFTSSARGGVRLYTIPATGGTARRVSTGSIGGSITEADWSPDGKWIAFTSVIGGRGTICVMESSGGEATPLFAGEDPCWAPNSRNLVFMREKNGRKTLSLLDVPTKRVKDVRQTAGEQSQPSWAR